MAYVINPFTGLLDDSGSSSGGTTVTSTSNSDGTLTISPTTGDVIASLALGHANAWTGQQTFGTSSPIFSTMTAGSVFFAGTSGLLSQDNAKLFWDNTSKYLGIGTNSPTNQVHVNASNSDFTQGILQAGATTGFSFVQVKNTSGYAGIGVNDSVGSAGAGSGLAYATIVGSINSTALQLVTNDTVRMTFDTSGKVGIGTTSPGELLSLGLAGTTTGVLSVSGATSGKIIIQPATAAGTWTWTLPTDDGTNGQLLTTDGNGVTSWTTVSAGGMSIGGAVTSGTTGSVLFIGAGPVLAQDNANFFWDVTNHRLGLGTTAPSNILSLGNGAAQKFWIENSATDVVGRAFTIAAGGTVAGTSVNDVTGGNLIIQAGLGTGTGASTISFQTGTTLTTGKTLQTMSTKMTILGSGSVGIGTTSPNNTFEVASLISFDNTDFNTKVGYQAGLNLVAGAQNNCYLGYQAGLSSAGSSTNAADNNTGIGYQALLVNQSGTRCTAVGTSVLVANTSGTDCTGVGYQTLKANTSGQFNTAVGSLALITTTGAIAQTAVGYKALTLSTGNSNTAVGYQALAANSSGTSNVAVGVNALLANTTGSSNIAIGVSLLSANTTGAENIAIGSNTLASNTTGGDNVGIGFTALNANSSGNYNIGIGWNALILTQTVDKNIGIGYQALSSNTTGANNVGLGNNVLNNNGSGSNNLGLGSFAGKYETGSNAFYVDNQDRTNTAGDKAGALIYGTFNATASSQTLKFNATTSLTNKTVAYNGINTAGWGLVPVYAAGRSTAQTAAVATVATYTCGGGGGSFEVSANVLVTTSTVHSFTVTCTYTDEASTLQTLTLSFSNLAGTFLTTIANAGGAVPYEGVPLHIRCGASTAITIGTTGTFTTVTYNVEGIIKQMA